MPVRLERTSGDPCTHYALKRDGRSGNRKGLHRLKGIGQIEGTVTDTMLKESLADLFAFGVPFIANPDLPRRLRDACLWPNRILRPRVQTSRAGLEPLPAP
jgi:2,4-dienoyl-CoA reductase-like NADH-dependent reductase (Old Yellow Enzyme family)